METDHEGFSIREYTRNVRSVDIRKCCPFPGEFNGDFIQSLLPPLTVTKFRWWSHELTSLLTKSPDDDPKPAFRQKANVESSPCKKRSIGETQTKDLVLLKKKIKTKKLDDSFNTKTDNKVYNCEEQVRERSEDDGKCSLGNNERSRVMSPSIKKAGVRCLSYTEEGELFPDSSRSASQDCDSELQILETLKVAKRKFCSMRSLDKSNVNDLQLCCSQMNRLALCSAEDQSFKVMSNDQTSDDMALESRQLNKFQPVVSERRLSHARAQSSMSCFPGPHLTLERIKDALDLERKRRVAQPISSLSEIHYRSCSSSLSQPVSVLNKSPFDPLLVEKAISGFPLVEANGSSAENDILQSNFVDISSGTEPALATDEKHHVYYPARLGLDETFTENAFFISDANDTVTLAKQEALSQNLSSTNMVATPDGLCLQDTQSTLRLMGKDVSVGTSCSEDASIDYSFLGSYAQQSWLWRTTTLGENHSISSLDKSWNQNFLCDPYPMFCEPHVVPDSELPPTFLYPCVSLITDNDLGSGLGQQLASVTFSQQQLPFPSHPEIAGLPSDYRYVGVGCLLPDAREPSSGLPFTSTTQSQLHWPQSSFES